MIPITPRIAIDERDLSESFVRASGPGGQNVNKVSTAVQLRYRLEGESPLPESVRLRLQILAGRRLTLEGEILIEASSHRTQEANRRAALERLIELIQRALVIPKKRVATKPSKGSKERRVTAKKKRATVKGMRGRVKGEE